MFAPSCSSDSAGSPSGNFYSTTTTTGGSHDHIDFNMVKEEILTVEASPTHDSPTPSTKNNNN